MVKSVGIAACPACVAAPVAMEYAAKQASEGSRDIHFSVPTVNCAACMSVIERGLRANFGVEDARVNLTRKRLSVRISATMSVQDVVTAVSALGYEALPLDGAALSASDPDKTARDLAMRLGVAGFAMMNVMLLSIAVWSGATDATRDLFHWISAAIAVPTVAYCAQPFFRNAMNALRHWRLNMDVPISLAIILALALSMLETVNHGDSAYFDAALSLTFFLLAGRYLDQKMRSVARSAASELAAMEVPSALKIQDDTPVTVRISEVAVGDILLVRPGARVPVDGEIIEGQSELDRSFLTGESDPVPAGVADHVHSGTINLTGAFKMRALAVGQNTVLHRLAELVAVAEHSKSKYNSLADQAARIYAPAVHLVAFTAFVFWMWMTGGDVRFALNIAVATLIITCPCALGLAVPAVSTVASGRLFKAGLLVKHNTALERLAMVDEVIFDKTGTLTSGKPRLMTDPADADMALACALATGSAHPRSQAIVQAAAGRALPEVTLSTLTEYPGRGVEAQLNGRTVRLGRAQWIGAQDGSATVLDTGERHIFLEFLDTERPGAAELIAALKTMGLPVTLLSGDTEAAVRQMADKLGISQWQAALFPQEKADILQDRAAAGKRVLMVGDGLNDVGALSSAHVSIAPASALEITRVAADMVFVGTDLSRIAGALRTARSARRRILENFGVAAVYNAISVPLAFFGFATPLAAAVAMSGSSIMVSLNALRTK